MRLQTAPNKHSQSHHRIENIEIRTKLTNEFLQLDNSFTAESTQKGSKTEKQ